MCVCFYTNATKVHMIYQEHCSVAPGKTLPLPNSQRGGESFQLENNVNATNDDVLKPLQVADWPPDNEDCPELLDMDIDSTSVISVVISESSHLLPR